MTLYGITFDMELLNDAVQIFILYLVFYWLLRAARGSRFGQVLTGVGLLFAALIAFTYLFHFNVLSRIVQGLLFYLALSSVVIFQPEIRRILATIGSLLFQDRTRYLNYRGRVTPEMLAGYICKISQRQMGALLAIERGISLKGYEVSGVMLDAIISAELLLSIFKEPMPLHDGGVVIRHGRISSAHCLFPVSVRTELSESGMRHRAAVGLSEETDALVIVVSEETGKISVAHNGRLIRYPDTSDDSRASLVRWIRKAMPQQKSAYEQVADWFNHRREKAAKLFSKGKAEKKAEKVEESAKAEDNGRQATEGECQKEGEKEKA